MREPVPSLRQQSLDAVLETMTKCNFDNYDFEDPLAKLELFQPIRTLGNMNPQDICDALRQDITSLSRSPQSIVQSIKRLLVVAFEGDVHYFWYQIHAQHVQGPPIRYSPYPRPSQQFVWCLHVVPVTNHTCTEARFKNPVIQAQGGTRIPIPTTLSNLLNNECPLAFRAACHYYGEDETPAEEDGYQRARHFTRSTNFRRV